MRACDQGVGAAWVFFATLPNWNAYITGDTYADNIIVVLVHWQDAWQGDWPCALLSSCKPTPPVRI